MLVLSATTDKLAQESGAHARGGGWVRVGGGGGGAILDDSGGVAACWCYLKTRRATFVWTKCLISR